MSAGKIFNPNSYKGKSLTDLAPEAKFTSMWQVIAFWIFNLWLLHHIGGIFGINVLYEMFGWIPFIGRLFG